MRVAVFGDIHGNRHALEATWRDIESQGPDRIYCLGDLVGYGAFPNEVTERVQAAVCPTVMGNYDDGVGYDRDECGCAYREALEQERGQQSLAWTRAHTSPANKAYLRTLLPEIRFEVDGVRVLLVHGSPRRMNEYLFEDRPLSSFQRLAQASQAEVIAYGHTHRPYRKLVDGVSFINAGSVGKPKDGDPRACWVLLDIGTTTTVEFRRVSYDVAAAAAAIRASGLPSAFARDLELGGSPDPAGMV